MSRTGCLSTLWVLGLVAIVGLPGEARAACPTGQVFVRAKTPVRQGPALNYEVSRFLERGRCAGLEQVSMDGRWTLLRLGDAFGWVTTDRLDAVGQERAAAAKATSAPIGSGTERAFSEVVERAVLFDRPQSGATPRRIFQAGARVLALRLTPDGAWVEVRDDRGDVGWVERERLAGGKLSELPEVRPLEAESAETLEAPLEVPEAFSTARARRRMGAQDEGVHLTASALGAALFPMQRLDSDGVRGIRRYDLQALSAGAAVDLQLTDLGPITARMGGILGVLSGLAANEGEGSSGGSLASLVLRAGLPLSLGTTVLTPEVGYAFDATDLDVAPPGGREPTFVSSQVHAGLAGARLQVPVSEAILLEGDLAATLGVVSSRPGTLGASGGLAFGAKASVGAQYLFDAAFGLVARYVAEGFTADFSGTGSLDPTITRATLGELRQALLFGASYAL